MTLPMSTNRYADFASFSCHSKNLNYSVLTITKKSCWSFNQKSKFISLKGTSHAPTSAGFKLVGSKSYLLSGIISLICWTWFCTQTFHTSPYCFIHHRIFSLSLQQQISFTLTSLFTASANKNATSDNNRPTTNSSLRILNFLFGTNRLIHPKKSLKRHEYMTLSQNKFRNKYICHYTKTHEDW